jgi:hypothetical protein
VSDVLLCVGSSREFYGTSRKKLEALHMKSMILHGSCALDPSKVLLYHFVYAVKSVLKKPHFGQKVSILLK